MGIFKTLDSAAMSSDILSENISKNIINIIDYANKPFNIVEDDIKEINAFIDNRSTVLRELDYSEENNVSFLLSLFELSHRLGLQNIVRLTKILDDNDIELSSRQQAIKLFLVGIRRPKDLISNFSEICEKLQFASEFEEDNSIEIDLTFANYLLVVVRDAQFAYVVQFFESFKIAKEGGQFSFMNSDFIESLFSLDINVDNLLESIIKLVDAYIIKVSITPLFNKSLLFESNTEYSEMLEAENLNFDSIRAISVKEYQKISSNAIFHSLSRGVAILTKEEQLYAYMNSYGNMHYYKLQSAFEELSEELFDNPIQVIDWGCGQGMATIALYDFLNIKGLPINVANVTLIEPSEVALRRAALHVNKCFPDSEIVTVNKDLDSLETAELHNVNKCAKLHLFSNILDIDYFSMNKLIDNLNECYRGSNYFVCVSPYVTESKKNRLTIFSKAFSSHNEYEMIANVNNREGEWKQQWTRVMRVFKLEISQ